MAVINVIVFNEFVNFLEATNRLSLPFGFRRANIGLAYLLKDKVVMIPYLCSSASSKRMSSLKLIRAGRL